MNMLSSGDLVKPKLGGPEMIVVGVADFHRDRPEALPVFCVWERTISCMRKCFKPSTWR